MKPRGSPAPAVVGCAVGGLLVLLTAGRQWAHATVTAAGGGRVSLTVTGHQVAPALPATGVALLALAAAIIAASGALRRVVGVAVVVVAAATVAVSLAARGDVSNALRDREVGSTGLPVHAGANGWWLVALAGALLALGAGAVTVAHARRWSRLGARYDAPSAVPRPAAHDPAVAAWDALDHGEDPTAEATETRPLP